MSYTQEQLTKHFGDPTGFSRVSNTLTRLYTQLEGFDATTVGLYAYLRSWRNTSDEEMRGIVWHSREYLYAQSGLGRKAFEARLRVLEEYGLVSKVKSPYIANKDYFIVHDPLERDEFILRYSDVVDKFIETAAEIEKRNIDYRRKQLAEEVEEVRKCHAEQWNVQNGLFRTVQNGQDGTPKSNEE